MGNVTQKIDYQKRLLEYLQVLAERTAQLPSKLDVYRSASDKKNLPPPGLPCMTLFLRLSHDIKNYLVVAAGKKLSEIPPETIQSLGPLELWKEAERKEKAIYFFGLIYEEQQGAFFSLKENGYCTAKNKMARDWGRKIPPFGFLCEKCRSNCYHFYRGDDQSYLVCKNQNCKAYYLEDENQPSGFAFQGHIKPQRAEFIALSDYGKSLWKSFK